MKYTDFFQPTFASFQPPLPFVYVSNPGALKMSFLTHFGLLCLSVMIFCVCDWHGAALPSSKVGSGPRVPAVPCPTRAAWPQAFQNANKSEPSQALPGTFLFLLKFCVLQRKFLLQLSPLFISAPENGGC